MNIICKHCGSEEGFYIKTRFYGSTETHFNNDGTKCTDFGRAIDAIETKFGKNVYCSNCNKVICKVLEIEDELES